MIVHLFVRPEIHLKIDVCMVDALQKAKMTADTECVQAWAGAPIPKASTFEVSITTFDILAMCDYPSFIFKVREGPDSSPRI